MIRATVLVLMLGLVSGCQMYRKSNDPIHRAPPPGAITGQFTPFSMMTTTYQQDRYRLFLAGGGESVSKGAERASLFTLASLQANVPEVPDPEGELVVLESVMYEPLADGEVTGTWAFDQPACRIRLRTVEGHVFATLEGRPVSVTIHSGIPTQAPVLESATGFTVTESRAPGLEGRVFFDLSRHWACP
ncbi:hypothetical protein KUV59_09220 [Marinobacter daepoensis]|uniref:hypothetical protein n=1 Tax=Marinobacter daepoensis TaxID=262077 RepID=UPI001C96C0F7|nr:hypothetical protein [Marinobacter daepoensis]MBY6033348.1 hypothetical protein [Marinobacter daepoensis]